MASDVSLEDLQAVFTGFGEKLDAIQHNQTKALDTVLRNVAGLKDTKKYKNTLSEKFEYITNAIKGLSKNTENSTEKSPASSKLSIPALDGVIPTTLSKNISNNTKALPVRIIDALDLKSKKTEEVKTGKYSSVYIELPESTRDVIDNLLHDNLKYFFDDLFNRGGGVDDIYKTLHNIYELIGSDKFNSKRDKTTDSWWKNLLPFLPEIAAGLAGLAAGLGEVAAAVLGLKALKALFKPLVEGENKGESEAIKTTSKTDAERTAQRAKEEEERLETAKKLQDAEKQLRDQEIVEKEADIKRLEDLIKKKENSAKNLESIENELREKRMSLKDDLGEHLKEIDKIDNDIARATERATLAGNDSIKDQLDLLERRRTAFAEESELMKGEIKEVSQNIAAIADERELVTKHLEEIKNSKPVPEPKLAPESIPAPEPKPGKIQIPEAKLSEESTVKSISSALDMKPTLKGATGKIAGGVGTAFKAFQALSPLIDPTSFGPEPLDPNDPNNLREFHEQMMYGRILRDTHNKNNIKHYGKFAVDFGATEIGDMLKGLWDTSLVYSKEDQEEAFKEFVKEKKKEHLNSNKQSNIFEDTLDNLEKTKQYIKDSTDGKISWAEQQRRGPMGGAEIWGSNIQPVEDQTLSPEAIKYITSGTTSTEDLNKALQAQTSYLKDQLYTQKQTADIQKNLLETIKKGQLTPNSSVNIVNASSTSINSQQTSSPTTRNAFSNRSYGGQ